MLSTVKEKKSTEFISPSEYSKSYQDDNGKISTPTAKIQSDNIDISDAGREALNSSQTNINDYILNNNAYNTEETTTYTMKSAKNNATREFSLDVTNANLVATNTLKSGTTVNIYTDDYADDEEKIPGTSQKIMAEIIKKDGSTEVVAITENTVISEDASGQTIIKEVPRTTQNTEGNANAAKYNPTNIQGTDGDDIVINIFEGTNSIQTGKGNDTVISFHSVNEIDLGEGDNKLQTLGGSYQNITAGDGNNTMKSKNSLFESISLGDGANKINVSSVGNLRVGDGNNNIGVQNLLNGLKIGNGDNNLKISTMYANSQLNLGEGSNDINIKEMKESSVINNTTGNQNISILRMQGASLNLEEGDHKVSIQESDTSVINAKDGDSTFKIKNMQQSNLIVGEGNNSFHIQGLNESAVNIKKKTALASGKAKDSEQNGQVDESPQESKNKFYIDGIKKSEINTGDGDTTFHVRNMNQSIINSGKGNDKFYFDEIGSGNLTTGAGDDTIYVKGSIWGNQNVEPFNLDMGEGNNKLNVQGHVHKLNFTSTSGNDSVEIGSFISDSNIDTGYGADAVKRNLNTFVHNSNISFGLTEEEQIKSHATSSNRGSIIQGDMNFAKTNPNDKKLLDETLKKSPFYTPPFSLQTGHTKVKPPIYDTAFKANPL